MLIVQRKVLPNDEAITLVLYILALSLSIVFLGNICLKKVLVAGFTSNIVAGG